jgi:hypothetical protein
MECFLKRLEKYIKVRPTAALIDVIVKIMVEVLSILGIVTEEIGRGKLSMCFRVDISANVDLRAERFLTKLAGMRDVEDALRRLGKLTQEEVLMAAAEGLAISREIGDKVEGVDHKVSDIKRSLSFNLVTADRESLTSHQGMSYARTFESGSLPPIHLSISTLHPMLITRVPQLGAPKGVPS